MSTSVFGLVSEYMQADSIVSSLKMAGFRNSSISVLVPDTEGFRDAAYEKHSKAPEGTATGAGTGALLGGTLGWLAGIGALAIPGAGPFIAAGPIMAGLSGAAVGGALGGVGGGLVGLGIPEIEAKQYEGKILEGGNMFISVHTETKEEEKVAEEILKNGGAKDVSRLKEEPVKQPK